jgi:hypothetical protein
MGLFASGGLKDRYSSLPRSTPHVRDRHGGCGAYRCGRFRSGWATGDIATTQRYADYAPNEREVEMVDQGSGAVGSLCTNVVTVDYGARDKCGARADRP